MVKISGGSAAIHGFLYQMLAHLDWATKLSVAPSSSGATMRLEPVEGGDAEIKHEGRRILEQYKTRKAGGTWSVKEVVQQVLTDFIKIAQIKRTPGDVYRFVTSGKVDHQNTFLHFLKRIKNAEANGTLDNKSVRNYRSFGNFTDQGLVDKIRSDAQVSVKKGSASIRVETVFHVLSRVELAGGVHEDEMRSRVLHSLRRCLPNPQDAESKLSELVGKLMENLSLGEFSVDARAFLEQHEIDPARVALLANLAGQLRLLLTKTVTQGSHRYSPDQDVRKCPEWDLNKSQLLAVCGRVGVGKTWQLMRLGLELADRGHRVVYASMCESVTRTLDAAAGSVWNLGLHTSTVTNIATLNQALERSAPVSEEPWLVVLVDGTVSGRDMRDFIDFIATDPSIRIAITMPSDVAQRMQRDHPHAIGIAQIDEFNDGELETYLSQFGIKSREIPLDLLKLLRLPLLANLYVRSGVKSFRKAPTSEYELFEELWKRADSVGASATATRLLREIARHANQNPDQRDYAMEHALPNAGSSDLEALAQSGWIEIEPGSRVRFAHDRLLNWAFADAVATDVIGGTLSPTSIVEALKVQWSSKSRWGYVFMDVLWRLSADSRSIARAADVLQVFESGSHRVPVGHFFEELLPTIGKRALRLLDALIARVGAKVSYHRLAPTVRSVGRQLADKPRSEELVSWARSKLTSDSPDIAGLGLALVETAGLDILIDDVFVIHVDDAESRLKGDRAARTRYERSFEALKACVHKVPQWLSNKIGTIKHGPSLRVLSWQLFNLESDVAPRIWADHKSDLVKGVAPDESRGILSCIRRFKDRGLVGYVENALASGRDFDVGVAMGVLAKIDPVRGAARLNNVDPSELRMSRHQWLIDLYRASPTEVDHWLERIFLEGSGDELFELVEREASDRCGALALVGLRTTVDRQVDRDASRLGSWTKVLSSMRHGTGLRAMAGSTTEEKLVDIAKGRIDSSRTWHDHLLEDARQLLIAIGGDGAAQLVEAELRSVRGRHADKAMRILPLFSANRLEALLLEHVAVGAGPHDEDARISNHEAIVALTAVGSMEALAAAIRNTAIRGCPLDALTLRRQQAPFPSELVLSIRARLSLGASLTEDEIVAELVLVSLSQSPELRDLVHDAMRASPDSESIFIHGAIALLEYPPVSEAIALGSGKWFGNDKCSSYAFNLHLRCGSEATLKSLLDHAASVAVSKPTVTAEIAARLPVDGPLAMEANDLAVRTFHAAEYAVDCYYRAAESGDLSARALLRQRAYQGDASFLDTRSASIRALGEIDINDAVEAALWLVQQSDKLDQFATRYVTTHGTDAQCLRLIEFASGASRTSLISHVGRSIRARDRESTGALLQELMPDERLESRFAFASLAGWFGTRHRAELRSRIELEHSPRVLKALEAADSRSGLLETLGEHLEALSSARGNHRAALLQACLTINEPFLLLDEMDEYWIGNALAKHPPYFLLYAKKELKQLCDGWKDSK